MNDLLTKYIKGLADGAKLEKRLSAGETYTREERLFLMTIMGRHHLMQNCKGPDKFTKEEKMSMINSFIEALPHLKSSDGPKAFYDPVSHTGHLEAYVRCRRSRSREIVPKWTHKKSNIPMRLQSNGSDDEKRILRERKPNASNKEDLLRRMASTREDRRQWIADAHPTITEIVRVYPRLQDMDDAG